MPIYIEEDSDVNVNIVTSQAADVVTTRHTYKTQQELQTSVLFNKEVGLEHITQYVTGGKWEVDYFLQVRGINDDPKMPDPNVGNETLKYNRINKLLLNLQSELVQGNVDTITGEAIINSGFVPSYGDAFKAIMTGGQEAIFVIMTVDKNTYNNHDAYLVTFKLFSFLHTDAVTYNDLVYKTLKEYVYDKEHLLDYSAPIILAQDYIKKVELKKQPAILIDYYLKLVINRENYVIALPTLSSIYVDTLLNGFFFKLVNISDSLDLIKLNRLDFTPNEKITYTVWDAILNRDANMLDIVDQDIGFKFTPIVNASPIIREIGYLDINFVVNKLFGADPLIPATIENTLVKAHTDPLGKDLNSYVFSDSFYNRERETCGLLEKSLLTYIEGGRVLEADLTTMLNEYKYWTITEQYYLIPILLLLVKDSINFTYTSL